MIPYSTLYGWDFEVWKRAIKWARRTDITASNMIDEKSWNAFREIQQKWLKAGGPMNGPTGLLE